MISIQINESIASCVLDAPPANTISPEWCRHFHAVLDDVENNGDVAVLHIKSALKLFCAGADLKLVASRFSHRNDGLNEFTGDLRSYQELFLRIEKMQCTTVAEIGGAALGGGLELALACDLRVVSHEAKIGLPEVGLGLLPAIGGTQRLSAICGEAVAKRLILIGEVINGERAVHLGVAQWGFPASDLVDETAALVKHLSRMPKLSSRFAKECIHAARDPSGVGFGLEITKSQDLFRSDETKSAVAEFLNRKTAR